MISKYIYIYKIQQSECIGAAFQPLFGDQTSQDLDLGPRPRARGFVGQTPSSFTSLQTKASHLRHPTAHESSRVLTGPHEQRGGGPGPEGQRARAGGEEWHGPRRILPTALFLGFLGQGDANHEFIVFLNYLQSVSTVLLYVFTEALHCCTKDFNRARSTTSRVIFVVRTFGRST